MKKLLLVLALPLTLTSCVNKNNGWHAVIQNKVYAYQTSEAQENTHDVYLAVCKDDVYIEIPEDYDKSYVSLKNTGKMIYYYVYEIEEKVSNKGWEAL